MAIFHIPLRVDVPAHGSVDVEASTFEEACAKLQADIDEHGFVSNYGEVDYTTYWESASVPALDRANFPKKPS